jgi:hypothetical protein
MTVQDIIALLIVGVAVLYAGRALWRTLHGETGCAGECGCSAKRTSDADSLRAEALPSSAEGGMPAGKARVEAPAPRGVKRLPLVPIEQIGTPPRRS